MTYTEATSWHTAPAGTTALWTAALARHGADLPDVIASTYFVDALAVGLNPDLALAQACHETGWFTSQRWLTQRNPAGIGITSSTVAGPAFGSVGAGIEAHLAHLCCYVYTLATCPIERNGWHDPRHSFHDGIGAFATLERPERRWAYPGDGYLAAILAIANAVAPGGDEGEATVSVPKPAMDTSHRSPNSWPNDALHPRQNQAVVWHITEGTSSLGWLTSEASQVSSNYLIDRDGTIHELVDPHTDSAWANGPMKSPNTSNKLIALWFNGKINPNERTISIEHEGMSSDNNGGSLTAAQVKATVALTAWLCSEFGIAPDQDHILGHYEINDVDKHFCPGFSPAEWTQWIGQIAALVNSPTSPPVNTNPGFPNALQSDGRTVLNTVDFGGQAVCVEEVSVQVRNAAGERYQRRWVGYHLDDWQRVDAPAPAPEPAPQPEPAPTPAPQPAAGGTMEYHDHGGIPLARVDPHGSAVVDPASGNAYVVYADVQTDHAFVVWSQAKGDYLPQAAYNGVLARRWLLAWQAVIHEGHLKVLVTTSAAGNAGQDVRSGFLDLGAVTAQ